LLSIRRVEPHAEAVTAPAPLRTVRHMHLLLHVPARPRGGEARTAHLAAAAPTAADSCSRCEVSRQHAAAGGVEREGQGRHRAEETSKAHEQHRGRGGGRRGTLLLAHKKMRGEGTRKTGGDFVAAIGIHGPASLQQRADALASSGDAVLLQHRCMRSAARASCSTLVRPACLRSHGIRRSHSPLFSQPLGLQLALPATAAAVPRLYVQCPRCMRGGQPVDAALPALAAPPAIR